MTELQAWQTIQAAYAEKLEKISNNKSFLNASKNPISRFGICYALWHLNSQDLIDLDLYEEMGQKVQKFLNGKYFLTGDRPLHESPEGVKIRLKFLDDRIAELEK